MATGRVLRRLEQPREQVLVAALEMVGERGLAGVTMAALAARLGTSGGHLLYYFGSKDRLLMETLRWSESSYTGRREEISDTASPEMSNIVDFADLFLPADARDPRWLLWLEVWARSPYVAELAAAQGELEAQWRRDLLTLVERGNRAGTFTCADPAGWCERLLAMLDGFSIALVTGAGAVTRDAALDHVREISRSLV